MLLPAAYLVDQLAGDPEWFPHPVRLIGHAISGGERILRRLGHSPRFELLAGTGLAIVVVGSSYWITFSLLEQARTRSKFLGDTTEVLLAWTCLAARNLEQEAEAVTDALQGRDISSARSRLARIVGRDTGTLETQEISRAVIETVAESASDGIVAPLFYMALGGVPLAMAYKAINTLDSMIGHADANYFYFGKFAARLDDLANYLPSRISALTIVGAARLTGLGDWRTAWKVWQRDGWKHKSPNAGQPESAMAGALQVSLGGRSTYAGEEVCAPILGEEFSRPTAAKAVQAIHLVSAASLLGLGVGLLLTILVRRRNRA